MDELVLVRMDVRGDEGPRRVVGLEREGRAAVGLEVVGVAEDAPDLAFAGPRDAGRKRAGGACRLVGCAHGGLSPLRYSLHHDRGKGGGHDTIPPLPARGGRPEMMSRGSANPPFAALLCLAALLLPPLLSGLAAAPPSTPPPAETFAESVDVKVVNVDVYV